MSPCILLVIYNVALSKIDGDLKEGGHLVNENFRRQLFAQSGSDRSKTSGISVSLRPVAVEISRVKPDGASLQPSRSQQIQSPVDCVEYGTNWASMPPHDLNGQWEFLQVPGESPLDATMRNRRGLTVVVGVSGIQILPITFLGVVQWRTLNMTSCSR